MNTALLTIAIVFALLNGINDGSTITALGLRISSMRLPEALLILTAAVVAGPLLIGTSVATTLRERLVSFEGEAGRATLLAAVLATILVVAVLARLSFPTSLTIALVGGIAGAGLGMALPVAWASVAIVLAFGAAAPLIGAALAFGFSRIVRQMAGRIGAGKQTGNAHRFAYSMQCLAYGANDGQKMLAVFMVALGQSESETLSMIVPLVAAGLFLTGSVFGLPTVGRTIGRRVIPIRLPNAVVAELSAAGAALFSASLAVPVSMTQAVAGGLLGTGMSEGYRRVRWSMALQIAVAWALTLPAAMMAAACIGAIIRITT